MSYDYQTERPNLFTEDGADTLIKVRDNVRRLCGIAGAVRTTAAWDGVSGNTWTMLACLDYLVERGEIREITGPQVCGQDRVFVEVRAIA